MKFKILVVEKFKNCRHNDKTQYTSYIPKTRYSEVVFIPLFSLTFYENAHFGGKQSFRDISRIQKDDLAVRVSGEWFQM